MINKQVILFDVSFWQDNDYTPYKIDFIKMKSEGGDGVIIRAGQNVWLDEDYVDNAKAADEAGLPRGAYWFYDSRVHPRVQADLFVDVLALSGTPKLGIWGDFEERYGGPYEGEFEFKIFLDRLKEKLPNQLIGVYTAPGYWAEKTTAAFRDNFKNYPLWLAHYRVSEPNIPYPWIKYLFWQFTDQGDGTLYGAESKEIDMNIFSGTLEEYKTFFDIPDYTPGVPPEQGGDGVFEVVSTGFKMSLRETNEVTGNKIGEVAINTVMQADRIVGPLSGGMATDKWAHVLNVRCVDGVVRSGWVAVIHNGFVYCTYTEIPTTGTLPVLNVTLEADGYPTLNIEWTPNA